MNDLRKWKGMLGQGEAFTLIPNMMYVSREEGTQAKTHQRKPKLKVMFRPQVAWLCLCAWVGRAKLLPGRDLKLSLCTIGGALRWGCLLDFLG